MEDPQEANVINFENGQAFVNGNSISRTTPNVEVFDVSSYNTDLDSQRIFGDSEKSQRFVRRINENGTVDTICKKNLSPVKLKYFLSIFLKVCALILALRMNHSPRLFPCFLKCQPSQKLTLQVSTYFLDLFSFPVYESPDQTRASQRKELNPSLKFSEIIPYT
jgi:hypothetical protein